MNWVRRLVLLVVAGLVGQLGCLIGTGAQCTADVDCGAGAECTRTDECVPDGTALRVVVRWTVDGRAPTPSRPEPCARVGELEVVFRDPGSGPQSYRPVPCYVGQAVYDKMPPRFDSVEVVAFGPGDRVLDRAEALLAGSGETDVQVDLTP